ncbi:MAG TPA: PAS domain S-box protein, partial [Geminicoccaceae bacterium]|nr:PAS domain S-box protein [Geminicoccaceae bacterium]
VEIRVVPDPGGRGGGQNTVQRADGPEGGDPADRARVEAALRESEQRYRTLVETSPDAIHVHRNGVIILANWQAATLFGAARPEDLVGVPALSLVDEMSLELARARTARLRAPDERNEPVELTLRRLDGAKVVVEAASAAILLDGRLAVQAVLRDITERRRGEAALRRSEEQCRLALEAAGLGLWDVDYAAGRAAFDRRFRELYGLPLEGEVPGEALWGLVHPDDAPRVRAAVERAKDPASGGGYEVEYRALLPDGTERWHLAKAQVHFEGEGAARRPARFLGVVMDLSERRAVEAALRESEARYRATQEHAGVGIGEVDAAGRFMRVNEALCAIAGYAREELLARTVFDVTHPEDARDERADFARLVAGEIETYAREKRYLRQDGTERWVEVAATAVRDPAGRFRHGVRVVQDVTERKLAEARQRVLLGELSHRVKNTLAVVRGIALHSLRGDRGVDAVREVLEQRLGALAAAHDLLTAGDWRGVGLRELVAAELAPYDGRVATEGPDVVLCPKTALSLGLVLHELATNALKHGALAAPGGRVAVRWTTADRGRTLRLSWREAGGPEVVPPARRGFGSLLLERSVAHDLGGAARLEYRREGLAYELEAPLSGGALLGPPRSRPATSPTSASSRKGLASTPW